MVLPLRGQRWIHVKQTKFVQQYHTSRLPCPDDLGMTIDRHLKQRANNTNLGIQSQRYSSIEFT